MIKINRRVITSILHALMSLLFALTFLTGASFSFQNKEKTAFENVHLYSSLNKPYSSMIFEYKTKGLINDSMIWNYVKFANDFNGGKKYYNYGCLWSETGKMTFTHEEYSFESVVSDLSYLEERPSFSTNLLQLSYPSDYSVAFYESKTSFYFEYNSYKIKKGDKKLLNVKKGLENIENGMIEWSVSDNNIATIDSDGYVEGINPGQCIVGAKINDTSISIEITVSDLISNSEMIKFIPAVIPLKIANEIGGGEPKNSIGKTFIFGSNESVTTFIVGGYYENTPSQSVFRNKLYFDNLGERIYVPRNELFVGFRPNRILLSIGSKNIVNMNMFSDIQYLKKIINLSFNIPKDCEINHVANPTLKFKTIFECVDFVKSASVVTFGIVLLLLSLGSIILDFYILRRQSKKFKNDILLFYIFGLLIPLSLLALLNKIPIFGIHIFLVNSIGGVIFTIISFILSIVILHLAKEKTVNINNTFYLINI